MIASISGLPASNPPDEILTVSEVAKLLKCSVQSIYEMTRRRSKARHALPIPVLHMPFGLRFRRADITAWLDALAAQGGSRG